MARNNILNLLEQYVNSSIFAVEQISNERLDELKEKLSSTIPFEKKISIPLGVFFRIHNAFRLYMPESFEQDFQGCSEDKIIELENNLGITLPWIYKIFFLRLMGHGADGFLQGEDCFYEHLPDLQEWARELLAENDFPESLPDDAFVFFMHQGYQFSFFRLSEGDDPPIYFYCEGQDQDSFIKSHDSFSDFLVTEMQLFHKYATLCNS